MTSTDYTLVAKALNLEIKYHRAEKLRMSASEEYRELHKEAIDTVYSVVTNLCAVFLTADPYFNQEVFKKQVRRLA